ncbi:MAG: redoxin domain-containing protein [Alphaproteobacteria bacterium]|nr:redoxin domain-containing protein [Alphaproteobacteria bacterium]
MIGGGDPAPAFALPAVNRPGTVELAAFRDRTHVLLGLLRGIYCPFCSRHLAQIETVAAEVRESGVTTVVVMTTPAERARLYIRHRPLSAILASDPEMTVHRAFGLPRPERGEGPTVWPRTLGAADYASTRSNPTGEFAEPVPLSDAGTLLNRVDGFAMDEGDAREAQAIWNQLSGMYLIDRAGLVRWRFIEAEAGPAGIGQTPAPALLRQTVLAALA